MAAITGRLAFALTAGVLLAGCGGGPVTTATPGSPPSESAQPTTAAPAKDAAPARGAEPVRGRVPKCVAADVKGVFSEPDQGADIHGVRVIVTNTSSHACTIFGYGGLEMFSGGDGRPANITLNRVPRPGPTSVTLNPGDQANESLTWAAPGKAVGDPEHCTAFIGFVEIILPDDTRPFTVDGDLGQVCNDRVVDGRAFTAGPT